MRRTLLALAVVALLAAGCGDDDDTTATEDTTTTTVEVTTTSTTEVDETTTTTAGEDEGDPPGERIEIYPYEGASLVVVGVEADDVLNVRSAPDPGTDVVTELDPLAQGFTATGHNRQVGEGAIWVEVDTDAGTGWVNSSFVAHPGTTEDATARLYPDVADRPLADTLVELAEQVAADVSVAGDAPPRAVIVDGPHVGDLGEVVVDVLGYFDDSVLGERFHLFAEVEGGEAFRLRTIEATTLCLRGATVEGLCV